ncbi:MAG: hypothetical protein P9L92_02285 [Candidatus Electryonea clarkiae]|nr:hypothetical protein [Candidatus Electryonea clarkiae]MDP8289070.1 hypothetical protein [Candidatus Electryonea clarkiae]
MRKLLWSFVLIGIIIIATLAFSYEFEEVLAPGGDESDTYYPHSTP